jgi:hypothetical protein
MEVTTVGIDLAKNVFRLHGCDARCNPSGNIAPNPNFFATFDSMQSQQIRFVGGDASLNSFCDP